MGGLSFYVSVRSIFRTFHATLPCLCKPKKRGLCYIRNFSYIYPYFTYVLDDCSMLCYFAFKSVFDYMADFILDVQIFLYPKSVYCLVFPFVLVSNISLLRNLLYQRIFTCLDHSLHQLFHADKDFRYLC